MDGVGIASGSIGSGIGGVDMLGSAWGWRVDIRHRIDQSVRRVGMGEGATDEGSEVIYVMTGRVFVVAVAATAKVPP